MRPPTGGFGGPSAGSVTPLLRHWVNMFSVQQVIAVSIFLRQKSKSQFDVLVADVWITTGGTMYNDVARYTGEALHTCIQQSGNTAWKPVLVGFANFRDVKRHDEIRQQSQSIVANTTVTDEQVCRRLFAHVHRYTNLAPRSFKLLNEHLPV